MELYRSAARLLKQQGREDTRETQSKLEFWPYLCLQLLRNSPLPRENSSAVYAVLMVMSMPWSRSTQAAPGIPEVESVDECSSLMKQELLILFKHSPTCPVSWMAHREVMKVRSEHPDLPLYLISVRRKRDVSNYVAEETGIEHESPQIIIFRSGRAIGNASHDDISADFIVRGAVEKSASKSERAEQPSV